MGQGHAVKVGRAQHLGNPAQVPGQNETAVPEVDIGGQAPENIVNHDDAAVGFMDQDQEEIAVSAQQPPGQAGPGINFLSKYEVG